MYNYNQRQPGTTTMLGTYVPGNSAGNYYFRRETCGQYQISGYQNTPTQNYTVQEVLQVLQHCNDNFTINPCCQGIFWVLACITLALSQLLLCLGCIILGCGYWYNESLKNRTREYLNQVNGQLKLKGRSMNWRMSATGAYLHLVFPAVIQQQKQVMGVMTGGNMMMQQQVVMMQQPGMIMQPQGMVMQQPGIMMQQPQQNVSMNTMNQSNQPMINQQIVPQQQPTVNLQSMGQPVQQQQQQGMNDAMQAMNQAPLETAKQPIQ